MLNIFPVQFLAPVAYALLRLCVGFVFLYFGRRHIQNHTSLKEVFLLNGFPLSGFFVWYMVVVEIIIGTLFVLGLYTQIAALLAMFFLLTLAVMRKKFAHPLLPSRLVRVLLFFASLSLFITGAGIFAFDLPI